jgi:hypothetical protein
MRKVSCNCGHSFEADLPERVDSEKEPDRWQEILSGEFLTVECPNCGHMLKPDLPFHLKHASFDIDLYYVPEHDRSKALSGELPYAVADAKELVIGYPELVEKLTIADNGFDPRAIEVLKYYLLTPAMDTSKSEAEIRIRFHKHKQDKLVFYIEGLREEEIGVSRIPLETYNKVKENLKETLEKEPFVSLLSPPYASINKIYSEDWR